MPIPGKSLVHVRRASRWSTGTIRMVCEPPACVPRLGGYLAIRRLHPPKPADPSLIMIIKAGILQKR